MAKVRLLDPSDSKRRLDRYELIGELASGGMATVFLGRLGGAGGFQRFVAIKRLHPHLASEEEFIEMFLDEARLAAGIHHPHVVPILEVGESDSGYYLVMEYIEGDTLARLMARSLAKAQPIPRPVLIRIVLDALAGLHAAHELIDGAGTPVQLVHRDVSPQNILVGVDGASRITDFGVAHAAARLQNTRADRLKGKLAYMSPEQARAGDIDRRADIFAMGIILWEVLAAKRLFKSDSEAITLQRITVDPIPRLSDLLPEVHPALDRVCACALDRDPNRRYPTAADFAEALERAARDAASTSATDLGVASPREVAGYIQGALGEDIAAQRESVRAWLAHSEPSIPRVSGVRPGDSSKSTAIAGADVTMQIPLDRDTAAAAAAYNAGSRAARAQRQPPPTLVEVPHPLVRNLPPAPVVPQAFRMGETPKPPPQASPRRAPPAPVIPANGAPRAAVPYAGLPERTPVERTAEHTPSGPRSARAPLPSSPAELVIPNLPAPPGAGGGTPLPGPAPDAVSRVRVGSAPDVREALGIARNAPLLTADGASADEVPVEPRDDDEDDHETQLMDRDAAAAELMRHALAGRLSSPLRPSEPTPLPSPSAPPNASFSETPSRSIESFMIPAPPPPSRMPQLVALGVALLISVGGILAWLALHSDEHPAPAAPETSAAAPPRPPATSAPAPTPTPSSASTQPPSIPISALPPATFVEPPRLKGKLPTRGKASSSAAEPAPSTHATATPSPPTPPPPDLPKPDDLTNPYKPQ